MKISRSEPRAQQSRRGWCRSWPRLAGATLLVSLLAAPAAMGQTGPAEAPRVAAGKVLVEITFDGDYQRLEELAKRLRAEVVRFERPRLTLIVEESLLPGLRQEDYLPRLLDPEEVFEQLVRVEPPTGEVLDLVQRLGGRLVQREASYAVFRVSLRQLKRLQEEDLQVRKLRDGELVARPVEVTVPDEPAMALVVSVGLDVFEVRDGILYGLAYDDQIETLTRQGLGVKVAPRPYPPPE